MSRTFAFLVRSLRQESRLISHHLLRGALAAIVLLIFFVAAAETTTRVGAGGGFATSVLYCCYGFLTLAGSIYFSVTIVEEKEEQTLPLLRMTGATPLTILAGKSIPRLAVALLFILVVAPFLLLSITLGGVLLWGLLSSIIGLLAYGSVLCQIGLLASVVCGNAQRAFSLTLFLWVLVEWGGGILWLVAAIFQEFAGRSSELYELAESWAGWLNERSLLWNLSTYLTSWDSTQVWQPQMTYHLVIAGICFILSWLLFERCTAAAMAGTAETPTRITQPAVSSSAAAVSPSGHRVVGDALAWKSWQHLSGGWKWLWLRIVGAPLICVVITVGITAMAGGDIDLLEIGGAMIYVGIPVALINLARLLGLVLNQEMREKTLNGLLMLPHSSRTLVLKLIQGLLPAILAGGSCLLLGFLALLATGSADLMDLDDLFAYSFFWHFGTWVLVTVFLGMVLSVRMNYGGMLIAAAICWIGAPMVLGSDAGLLLYSTFSNVGEAVVFVPLMMIELIACWFLWGVLVRDVERLGARE